MMRTASNAPKTLPKSSSGVPVWMIVRPFTSTIMSSIPTTNRITNGNTPAGLIPRKRSTTELAAMLQIAAGTSRTLDR